MDAITVFLLLALAAVAPLLASVVGRVARVPLVVFEIVLGIIVGPSVLGWAHPQLFTDYLSQFGLATLFFVAGSEINFTEIKGRPITRAIIGWVISLVAAVLVGVAFGPTPDAGVFIGIALCSTALGTILPMLRDARELSTPFGVAVTAIGAVGEFGPLLAISIFLSGRNPGVSAIVLLVFVVIACFGVWLAFRGRNSRIHTVLAASLHTSGQFAIRLIIFLIGALVALSLALSLDMLLGAFVAGIMWRVLSSGAPEHNREQIDSKIEAVAFGFFVPIFFITTGMKFDAKALFTDPHVLLLVPVFLVLLVIVRGMPGILAAPPGSSRKDRFAIVLFGATGLPIIVAVTSIGERAGALSSGISSALVAAGLMSVLLFPLIAFALRGDADTPGLKHPTADQLSSEP